MLIDFTYFHNDVIFGLDFRGERVWHGVLDVVETQVLMHIALIFNVMAYLVLSIVIGYWSLECSSCLTDHRQHDLQRLHFRIQDYESTSSIGLMNIYFMDALGSYLVNGFIMYSVYINLSSSER